MLKDNSVPDSETPLSSISSSVLDRARGGDQAAFQRIVQLYAGLVYHWCRHAGLAPEDSEDVGQQVFLAVSRSLEGFRREKPEDSFRGWLRVITRSRIADHFRENSQRELAAGGDSSWNAPTATYAPEEDTAESQHAETAMLYERAVDLVRAEFAEQDYQAFHQVVVEGAASKDVAAKLGVSVNSVYIAKSRILKRLRDEFGELLGEDLA